MNIYVAIALTVGLIVLVGMDQTSAKTVACSDCSDTAEREKRGPSASCEARGGECVAENECGSPHILKNTQCDDNDVCCVFE
ncbi:unnamed protein product [Cyprideis torosa]|uniref:Uncharacterized protein n=1 Tax=Cyprideis torosa TaxID=163714 RepID=A0A7R8W485_9CRUS|nr:unnamed protein product [Cyprideis torosa]CAG0882881.1 unnamed protein product [Cyprideis torosa]